MDGWMDGNTERFRARKIKIKRCSHIFCKYMYTTHILIINCELCKKMKEKNNEITESQSTHFQCCFSSIQMNYKYHKIPRALSCVYLRSQEIHTTYGTYVRLYKSYFMRTNSPIIKHI